jgi:hypothetical protein
MARRAGKAASRKARQRRVQRGATPPRSAPAIAPTGGATEAAAAPEPVKTERAPRRTIIARQGAGSQLTASERSEYHYVERDLRDIVILTIAMAALLFIAWLAVRGLGLFG